MAAKCVQATKRIIMFPAFTISQQFRFSFVSLLGRRPWKLSGNLAVESQCRKIASSPRLWTSGYRSLSSSSCRRLDLRCGSKEIRRVSCGENNYSHEATTFGKGEDDILKVYVGPMTGMVKAVKAFSLSTSAIGLAMQPILISKALHIGVAFSAVVATFVGVYAVLTPMVLHWIAKRYVVYINFDPASRIFTSATLTLFFRERILTFSAEDVHIPAVPGPLTSLVVKGTPLLFDPSHFTDASVYAHMMGYDKPINLELHNKENDRGHT